MSSNLSSEDKEESIHIVFLLFINTLLRQIIFQFGVMNLVLLISSSHWPLDADRDKIA